MFPPYAYVPTLRQKAPFFVKKKSYHSEQCSDKMPLPIQNWCKTEGLLASCILVIFQLKVGQSNNCRLQLLFRFLLFLMFHLWAQFGFFSVYKKKKQNKEWKYESKFDPDGHFVLVFVVSPFKMGSKC